METIRSDKWHDPIVLFFCVLILIPLIIYGMVCARIKEWLNGPHEKCKQMKEMTEEELADLRLKYEQYEKMINK